MIAALQVACMYCWSVLKSLESIGGKQPSVFENIRKQAVCRNWGVICLPVLEIHMDQLLGSLDVQLNGAVGVHLHVIGI